MITLYNILARAKAASVYVDTPLFSKNGRYRMLMCDVDFELSDGRILQLQEGIYWDENTVPYVLQWAFPKSGMYAVPALVHDALYFHTQGQRGLADKEFYKWMRALGTCRFQSKMRYWMVRLFGWIYWERNIYNPRERTLRNRELITLISR